MNNILWEKISSYARTKLDSFFDATVMVVIDPEIESMFYDHKGFYIGVVDSSNNCILREGFLQDRQANIKNSIDNVVSNLFSTCKQNNITREKLQTSTFYFYIVTDCIYLKDPLKWDENVDGIYFMWGQKFRGLYLPYQIKQLGLSKIDALDRLLSVEIGVISTLWRMPEGLVFKISCLSYES